jgi:hypothetical protein
MSMRDAFSNLFPSTSGKGVAGVSGVAPTENAKIPRTSPETPPRNTSVINHAACVSPSLAEAPRHGGCCTSVSENTKETQRDDSSETPATPETSSKQYTRADFLNHADMFCAMPRPAVYSVERWAQIHADAKSFFDLWGSQVAALGWNPDNVFAIPDGLIPLIEGGDILAVCEKTAVVRAPSGKQFNTIRFKALSGEASPQWRVWASWCEP